MSKNNRWLEVGRTGMRASVRCVDLLCSDGHGESREGRDTLKELFWDMGDFPAGR